MSQKQRTQSGPVISPDARAALPFIANCHRNALEELGRAFTGLVHLISNVKMYDDIRWTKPVNRKSECDSGLV